MIRYLSFNRNLFYAFLFSLTMLFAGLDSANAQCPAATYTGSGGPYCVSGSPGFTLQSNASNPNIQKWQYTIDFGSSWVDIPSSNTSTYTPSAFPGGSYQIIYYQAIIVNCLGFGATPHPSSSPAGPITVVPLPVAGSFSFTSGTNATSTTICNGGTATYGLTGSNNLLDIAAGDIVTTSYSIANSNPSVGGTSTFTRTSISTGNLVINPTNVTSSIQTTTYTVTATNGTCTPVDIGSVTVCVYPSISGGVIGVTSATVCTGTSTTLSFTTLPTNIVATAGCTGTTYAVTSNAGSLSGSCGTVTAGIGGTFTTGNAPGTVTLTPTNTTNAVKTIQYTVTATNGPCANATYTINVDVVPNIVNTGISVATPTPTICSGQTATVNITGLACATGYINGLTTIVVSAPTFGGAGSANMSGGVASSITYAANSASFTVSPAISQCQSGTAQYSITAQNSPCSAPVTIGSVTVTVMPAIIAGATVTGTSTICTGASVSATTTGTCANGYGALTSYTLSVASSGANITTQGLPGTLTNATGSFTVNPTNLTCNNSGNTITYNINAINNATCSSVLAGSFTVTVTPNPVVNGQVFSITAPVTIVCNGASTTITPNNVCAGATYNWERQVNGGGYAFFGSFAGPLSTAAMTTAGCAISTYDFRLTINIGTCTAVANLPTITVYPTITASISAATASICSGGVPNFSSSTISCDQAGATYELLENGTPVVTNTTSKASFLTAIGTYASPVNYTCGNVVYNYSIRVTNNAAAAGCSVTSSTTGVTVRPAPSSGSALAISFTSTLSVCTGTPATITTNRCAGATATWEVSVSGGGFQTIASAGITMTDNGDATYTTNGLPTSACLTTTYVFRGTFTLGTCTAIASTSNTVSVFPAPTSTTLTITSTSGTLSSSTNADICTATNSTVLTSTVPACGSIVRWDYSLNGGTSWSAVPSSAANSITVTNVPQNTIYRAVISNGALCATTFSTNTVSITVNVVAGGTPTTSTPAICNGSSATITLGGYLGNIIDWQSAPTSAFGTITSLGSTANPLTVSPTASIWYRAQIGSGVCTTFSAAIQINVYNTPTNTLAAVTSPVCSSSASVLTLSNTNSVAGVTNYSIVSNYPSTGSSVYNSTTAPTSPYTVPTAYVNPNGVTNYTYTVTTSPCASSSASASITVNPVPTVTLTSAAASICNGGSTSITGTSTPVVAGTTTYTITAAPGGTLYASSTTAPTFPFAVTPSATTTYTYSVTNGACAPVTATSTVTVIPVPTATVTASSPICASASTILTLSTGSTTAGVTTYKITSDYPSANSDVYSTSTTAPTSPFTVPSTYVNPNGVTNYTFTVISAPCTTVTSSVAVTVNPVPTVTLAAAASSICNGGTTTITGTSTPVVAGTTTYTITAAPGGTLYASSTTAPTFPFTVTPSATTTYTYSVTNGACAPVSATTTVTVIAVPTATVTSTTPICATTSTVLTLSTTNTTAGLTTYKITSDYPSANSDVYSTSTTAPTSPFTVPAAYVNPNGVTNYTYTVISAPCGSATSTFAVTVQPASVGGTVSASATQCSPASGSLTLSGNTGSVVSWEFSTNGGTSWTTIANTTTTNAYVAITATTMYRAVVQNGVCATANSSAVTITVIPVPTATISTTATICASTSTVLTLGSTNGTSGLTTYKVTSDYPAAGSEVYATNTVAPSSPLTVDATNVNPNGVTTYTYTVTSAPCGAVTATTTQTVNPIPVVTLTNSNATICNGSSTTISGTASPVVAGTTTYTVTAAPGGTIYASSTTAPSFPLTVSPAATTIYTYTVTTGPCSAVSATTTVTVVPVPTASISSPTPICATSSTVLTLGSTNTTSGVTTYQITSDYPSAGSVVYATNTSAPNTPYTVSSTYVNPNGVTNYTYTVTSAPCGAVTATTAVTVHPVPTVTLTGANASICVGSSTTISGTATPVVAGTTTYKIGTTSGGSNIYASSTTAPTFPLTVTPATTTTYFYSVSNGACSPVIASVTVVVIPQPTATISSPTPICATSSTVLTLSSGSTVSGLTTYTITSSYPTAGSVVYATNTAAPNSPFTVNGTYINPNGVTTYTYTVTSSPCASTTASTSVTVHPVPTVTLGAAASTICNGSSTTITGTATPVVAGVTTYQITASIGGTLYAASTTAPTFPFTVTPSATTTYTYTITNGSCSPVTATTTVTVIPVPTASVTSPSPICASSSTILTLASTNTTSGVTTYKITSDYPSAGSVVYATNTTAPNSPFTVTSTFVNPNGVTNYTYTVTSAPCGSVTSTVAVTVYPVPSASITLSPSPICLGSTTTLSINIGNAVGSVTSYRIGTSAGGTDIVGATTIGTSGTFTTTVTVTPPVGVTTYFLTVTTSPCSSVSSNTSVTVNPTTVGGSLSAGAIVCPGSSNTTTFTLSGQTGSVVKWQQSTNDGASWTDITNTLTTYTATNVSVSTLYRAVVQSGVCPPQNSATTGVFVNTNPVANFSNTTVCFNTPPTVFTNSTSAGTTLSVSQQALYNIVGTVTTTTTYSWNFGDPTSGSNTSTLTNPTHAYTTDGTFNATLVATTNTLVGATTVSSCSNTITKQVTVNPVTTADYTTSPVCLGGASPVNISNFNSANTYSIVWGDATAAQATTTSTTTRTYSNPGQYSVRLKVTNIYGCSDSITKNVTAWALPTTTGVNISNTAPCVGSTVNFTPVGDAGGTTFVINPLTGVATATVANAASITNYLWDFGDGNTATTRVASNTYATAGTYTIKLTITNSNGCSQTFTFTATPVVVQPTPVASFSNTTECYGVATAFNSNGSSVASGTITGWSWNFGDPSSAGNNTSTTANPTHLFTAPGTYTVSLTVTTAAGCTNTTTKQVTVNPLPLVGFNPSATVACAGSTITFVSTSTITSGSFTYGWRVSDNAGNFSFASSMISANASLVQTFATSGTYNVRLYATSTSGCIDSATKTITINANPTAAIVVNPGTNQICIYETFTFTSTGSVAGSGTISSYAWTFGDGSTSTAANPAAKSYATPGNYTVTLTITNSNGCTNTTSKVVTVNPKPVVNFNATTVCFGYTMNFTDASTTSASSTYLWNFGDVASGASNTAITQNATHNYTTAGTFSVKLVVTNATGCKDSLTKLVTVWPRPVADFKADTVCEGRATTFTNLSTIASGSMSYVWYFGDAANSTSTTINPTFLYTPGVYSVKLVVTSGFGCIDSVRKSILVKPNPKPTFIVANACLRDAITLDTTGSNGSASVIISINYGDGSASTPSLTHTYAMSGIYTVTLTMTDNGCTSTISKVVTIYDLPLPSFSVSAYTICVNAVDTFSNTSSIASGTIVSNKWEVINASNTVVASTTYTSNQEFIYAFNTAGIYRVKLTATSNKGCVDTTSKTVTVNALPTVAINSINFKTQAFHACLGTPHEFTSTGSTAGSGSIASYFWDFGDGSSSTSQNPVYTYKAVGSFDVTLTITNSNGCSFSKTQSVVVDPIPDATIRPFNFPVQTCNGTPFTFTGPNGTGYSYVWTRSGAVIGTSQSVTVNPPSSGWYYLAVTSSFGCTKVDSIYLTVNPLPVITLSEKNVTISKGWNKQVTAVVTGPNPTFTYLWTAKDTSSRATISNNTIPNPILTPPNNVLSYYFVVTVTDQKGCVQRDTVFFTMLEDYNLKPTNLITPNGDNMNDYFFIENIETYDDVEVTIFNRWGNVVYQTKNYAAAPWNGTYQNTGGDLPDGTYYYIIRTSHNMADGKELIYKGNVTILRGR